MFAYFIRRLLGALPVLGLVLIIIFALVRAIPGDPAVALLGEGATDEQIALLRAQLRLDEPVWQQFTGYVGGLLQGDLGQSLRSGRPIREELCCVCPRQLSYRSLPCSWRLSSVCPWACWLRSGQTAPLTM